MQIAAEEGASVYQRTVQSVTLNLSV